MTLTTPRFALRYPQSTDADNVPLDMLHLATDLDNAITGYSQGTLASRPAAGVTGRLYRATDNGFTYMDIGTAWIINARPIADGAGVLAYNAAWPASPVDGQETDRFSDVTGQSIWRFRYDSAATAGFRWKYIGGAPWSGSLPNYAAAPTARISGLSGGLWPNQFLAAAYTPGVAGIFDIAFISNSAGGGVFSFALTNAAPAGAGPTGAHALSNSSGGAGMAKAQVDFTGTVGTARSLWGYIASAINLDCGVQILPVRCG